MSVYTWTGAGGVHPPRQFAFATSSLYHKTGHYCPTVRPSVSPPLRCFAKYC